MSASPDCPHCGSHDICRLNAAVTGVSGFRCQQCAKIFYVASADVTQRIHDAQKKPEPSDKGEPLRRTADGGKQ